MLRVVNRLAGGLVVGDAGDGDSLERGAAGAFHQFVLEGDDLALVGTALGRTGGLGVGNVLRDNVEAGLLGGEGP
jgi:hypothetical protein